MLCDFDQPAQHGCTIFAHSRYSQNLSFFPEPTPPVNPYYLHVFSPLILLRTSSFQYAYQLSSGTRRSAACSISSSRIFFTSSSFRFVRLDQKFIVYLKHKSGFQMLFFQSAVPHRSWPIFIISAAVPWIGAFIATRSPNERCIKLLDDNSGTGRRLPNSVYHVSVLSCMCDRIIQKFLDSRICLKIIYRCIPPLLFSLILKSWLRPKELIPYTIPKFTALAFLLCNGRHLIERNVKYL